MGKKVMTKVEKSIHEESEKISEARRAIKAQKNRLHLMMWMFLMRATNKKFCFLINLLDFRTDLWYCCVLQRRGGNGTDEFRRIVLRRKCGRKVRHYGRSDERLPPK